MAVFKILTAEYTEYLPKHLDTKDQEPVNQFGDLSKQERESGDSSRDPIGEGEGKSNNYNERMRNEERSDGS